MITTAKALDALKEKGLISDWKMKTYREEFEEPLNWKSPEVKSDKFTVSNETYGKESYLYFSCVDADTAKTVAKTLVEIGGKPDFSWCPDNPACFDLRVSSFHGYHWWE